MGAGANPVGHRGTFVPRFYRPNIGQISATDTRRILLSHFKWGESIMWKWVKTGDVTEDAPTSAKIAVMLIDVVDFATNFALIWIIAHFAYKYW